MTGDPVQRSYDAVADEYARTIVAVGRKPFDLVRLDRFVRALPAPGPVLDVGCGPGDVTRHLHDRGVTVTGIDLSPAMIERARRLHPGVSFATGDLTAPDTAEGSLAGITAFYCLIHFPPERLAAVLTTLRRSLRPGGLLLAAVHAGSEPIHLDEWWGKPVHLDTHLFRPEQVEAAARDAGFLIDELATRPPYPEIEFPSERIYLLARAPG